MKLTKVLEFWNAERNILCCESDHSRFGFLGENFSSAALQLESDFCKWSHSKQKVIQTNTNVYKIVLFDIINRQANGPNHEEGTDAIGISGQCRTHQPVPVHRL